MPPAAGGRAAALGLLLCACDGAAAQPDFTNCQEPVNMFNMGSGLQSSPCAVNTDAVEPAPGGGYLFTCWDSPVMLCDSDGGGPRPANCRAVGLLGCGGLYDLAFSAAGDALYAACGGEVRRCDWDAVTATPSGCAAVTGAVCPFDGMETGVALDGSTLVLGCYSSNKASDAGVLLCTLQAGGAAVQGSCTKRGEVPCGSATGQTMFRNVGLSLDSAGGAALGCRQDGSVYCSSFSVSSGPSGCSEPTPTSPCPSNTMGFTLLRSGQTAGMPRARQEAGDRVEVLVPANTAAVAAGVIAKVPVAIGAGAGLKGIMAMPGGGVVGAGGNGRATARMAAIVALLECPGEPTDVGMLASPTQLSLGSGDLAKLRGCVLGNWVLSGVPAAAAGILYRFHYFQAGNGVAAIAAFLFDATITGTAECGISLYAQSDPGRGWSVVSLCGLCAVALAMLVVSRRAAHWATAVHAYNRSAHQGWFKRLTAPRVIWQAKPEHERMVAACAMWFDGYRPYTAAEHGVATVLAIMAGAMVGWARDEVECAVALGLTAGSTAVQLIYTLVRNAHVRPIDTISAVLQLILEELCLGAQIVAVATLDPSAMRTAGVFATIATWLSIAKTVLNCLLLLHAVCCPAVMQFAKGLQPPLLDPDPEAQSQYAPALGQSVCPLSSGRRLVVPPQQLPGRRRSLSVLRLATCPLRQPAQPGAIAHSPPRHRQPHRVPDAADESTG